MLTKIDRLIPHYLSANNAYERALQRSLWQSMNLAAILGHWQPDLLIARVSAEGLTHKNELYAIVYGHGQHISPINLALLDLNMCKCLVFPYLLMVGMLIRVSYMMPTIPLEGVSHLFPIWMLNTKATRSTITRYTQQGEKQFVRISFTCNPCSETRKQSYHVFFSLLARMHMHCAQSWPAQKLLATTSAMVKCRHHQQTVNATKRAMLKRHHLQQTVSPNAVCLPNANEE